MAPVVPELRKRPERFRVRKAHAAMARPVNPYGDGRAARWIAKVLMEWNGDGKSTS